MVRTILLAAHANDSIDSIREMTRYWPSRADVGQAVTSSPGPIRRLIRYAKPVLDKIEESNIKAANHHPVIIINDSEGIAPIEIEAEAGSTIILDASASYDPDEGDTLTFKWWHKMKFLARDAVVSAILIIQYFRAVGGSYTVGVHKWDLQTAPGFVGIRACHKMTKYVEVDAVSSYS